MIYDEYGQIRFKGVTDAEDSPVAAAMAMLFTGQPVLFDHYFNPLRDIYLGNYRRCCNSKYTFSRDQTICLVTVLFLKGRHDAVSIDRADGADFMSLSVRGHERICKGLKPYWYQTLNFKLDLWFSATFKPLEELNQLFCMLLVHPDISLLTWYCEMNPLWREAIELYFCSWRDERDLANLMIEKIEHRISL